MSDVEKATEALKTKIDSLPETKEFLRLKKIIEDDKMLKGMRIEISKLNSEGKVAEAENLLKEYNSIPLVSNYNFAKEELYNLLKQISEILK